MRAAAWGGRKGRARGALLAALAAGGWACGSAPPAATGSAGEGRTEYFEALARARLEERALVREWSAAAQRALGAPTPIAAPYRETGYFDPARPGAAAFRFELRRGQELVVRVATAPAGLPLFVELLRPEGAAWAVLATLGGDRTLRFRAREPGAAVLLVQPELLAGGRYTLDVTAGAALLFPVEGGDRPVLSGFGSARDGGVRRHEGIDLGAPRGTLALAADSGEITAVGENALGGRIVRMVTDGGLTLYYAHLDRQLVRRGQRVERGQAVGRIGDTGNARGTPHLHFGLDLDGAARDPAPWIRPPAAPPPVVAGLGPLGSWCRAARAGGLLRAAPAASAPVVAELPLHQALAVEAAALAAYRVRLPDGRRGWVSAALAEAAESTVGEVPLPVPVELRAGPEPGAPPLARLAARAAAVLARAGETLLIEGPVGVRGWMEMP